MPGDKATRPECDVLMSKGKTGNSKLQLSSNKALLLFLIDTQ